MAIVTLLASYPYLLVVAWRIGSESLIENTRLDGWFKRLVLYPTLNHRQDG
ncbi:hypothetical protein [Nostoc sp. UHCC 0252]|uniref:hypothetical protein n=1 Tax=Nostoc sp. UHCC 0252 TaxID=3110241 RepID=UPI002B21CDB0|nr:hypothetical protein [Nostoc sp. UHCC 0252]MEA5600929.1 hypothetical protein [Nostoc sp. UHCC 0252]